MTGMHHVSILPAYASHTDSKLKLIDIGCYHYVTVNGTHTIVTTPRDFC